MPLFGPRVGHDALFDEVCKFLEIDRKEKTLLQTVVKKYQMPYPAEVFIEPETLLRALSDAEFAETNAELQKFYDAWFIENSSRSRIKK
jgi:hypothetical protein